MCSYANGNGDDLVKAALALAFEPVALVSKPEEVCLSVSCVSVCLCVVRAVAKHLDKQVLMI
jgi:hypothetical protein